MHFKIYWVNSKVFSVITQMIKSAKNLTVVMTSHIGILYRTEIALLSQPNIIPRSIYA